MQQPEPHKLPIELRRPRQRSPAVHRRRLELVLQRDRRPREYVRHRQEQPGRHGERRGPELYEVEEEDVVGQRVELVGLQRGQRQLFERKRQGTRRELRRSHQNAAQNIVVENCTPISFLPKTNM